MFPRSALTDGRESGENRPSSERCPADCPRACPDTKEGVERIYQAVKQDCNLTSQSRSQACGIELPRSAFADARASCESRPCPESARLIAPSVLETSVTSDVASWHSQKTADSVGEASPASCSDLYFKKEVRSSFAKPRNGSLASRRESPGFDADQFTC